MKYRIVREVGSDKFYIEQKRRFLFWTWWEIRVVEHPQWGPVRMDYDTVEEARKSLKALNHVDKFEVVS